MGGEGMANPERERMRIRSHQRRDQRRTAPTACRGLGAGRRATFTVMATHALFHFPNAGDAVAQALRVLSGAGIPNSHPAGPGLWGVAWAGQPRRLTPHESWIAIWAAGEVHGWARYCRFVQGTHVADPVRVRRGPMLVTDRVLRVTSVPFSSPNRSRYLNPDEAVRLGAPASGDGIAVRWTDGRGAERRGCAQ